MATVTSFGKNPALALFGEQFGRAYGKLSASQPIAKAYVVSLMTFAFLTVLEAIASWQSVNLWRFSAYLAIAIMAPRLKVGLRLTNDLVPLNSLVILLGIVQLTLPQALTLGCCSILAQYAQQTRERRNTFRLIAGLFSVSGTVGLCHRLLHASWWVPYAHPMLRCMLVACCYFLIDGLSGAVIVLLNEKKSPTVRWREFEFRSFGYYLLGAVLAATLNEGAVLFGWQTPLWGILAICLIKYFYGLHLGRLGTEKAHAEQMAALHLRTIEALALAIEAKDHTTHDHLRRVQVYAMEIGAELNLSATELDALRAAALLHDIGKLAVPEHIISKPGKLTPEEFEKMKIHPIVGAEILERVEFPYPVVPIVAAHHEKWDGGGYPRALKGEQIPIGARILSAVDCLDALATDRQYRRAIPLDEAMEVLILESGKAFDPQVISILKRRYIELEHMAKGTHADKLSTDCAVEHGIAPAAGFEAGSEANGLIETKPIDFLTAIAGARQEAQILFEMAQDLGNSLSLNETLSVMAVRMKKVIPYDGLAVYLKVNGKLKPAFVTGDDFRLFSSLEIPIGEGLSGWVAENKKTILNGNPSVESGYLNDPTKFSTLQSSLAVPLEGIDGVVGVLSLYHAQKDAFKRDHLRILLAISSKLALSVENNLKYRVVQDSATTDYLTGLPNAGSLFLHLECEVSRCVRAGSALTVLVCDLDGFKLVNDRFGHLEGNRILRLLADAMRSACRDYDCVARMGGDEFAIVLPGVSAETVDKTIVRLCAATNAIGWSICGEDVLALSVGRAVLPKDGCEAEVLLAAADMGMYKTKRKNKLARSSAASTLSLSTALGTTVDTSELASRPDIRLRGQSNNAGWTQREAESQISGQ